MKRFIMAAIAAGFIIASGMVYGSSWHYVSQYQGNQILPITAGFSDTVDTGSFTSTKLVAVTSPDWYIVTVYADTDIYFQQGGTYITLYNTDADTTATVTVSDTDLVLVTTGNNASDGTYTWTFSDANYNTIAELVHAVNIMPDIGWVAAYGGDGTVDSNYLIAAAEANALLVANKQTIFASNANTTNSAVIKQNVLTPILITGESDNYAYHRTFNGTTDQTLYVRLHCFGETGTQ